MEYSKVIETLKSLFRQNKITMAQLRDMVKDGKITKEEFEYIITDTQQI